MKLAPGCRDSHLSLRGCFHHNNLIEGSPLNLNRIMFSLNGKSSILEVGRRFLEVVQIKRSEEKSGPFRESRALT